MGYLLQSRQIQLYTIFNMYLKFFFSFVSLPLLSLLCFQVKAQEKSGIAFQTNAWAQVLEKARAEQKAVFLYAYTPACRYCRQMEKEVFPDQEVYTYYNATFVSYKINIEDGAEGTALAKKYGINAFPTYMYFNQLGEPLHQSGSGKSAADFLLDGKNAFNPQKALFSLKRKYETGDRSPALLFHYSNALYFYHQVDSPKEQVVGEYLATQKPQELTSEENLRYVFSKDLSFRSPATQFFLANQQLFIPLFGQEEVLQKAEKFITRTANTAGRTQDLALQQEVQQAVRSYFKDIQRLTSLAQLYYLGGKQEWLAYANATLAHGKRYASTDWRTLYETAIYLSYFSEDKEALAVGAQIMQQVTKTHQSYDNSYLQARLLQKAGNHQAALRVAQEALMLAKQQGEAIADAQNLIAELRKASNSSR